MKNLNTVLSVILVSLTFNAFSQKATADQIGNKEVKGNITEYLSDNGTVFKIGDTLEVGTPFRNNTFTYLIDKTSANMGTVINLNSTYIGKMAVIKSMKALQRQLTVATYGSGESIAVYINNFEEAYGTGEIIKPDHLTPDQALEELKKAKDKLDLELITQEEYDTIKAELKKYIK